MVAPFISELTGLPHGQATMLRACPVCDLAFFSFRYPPAILERLYGTYRSPSYVATRRRWEPWYGASVNDAYMSERPAVLERRAFLETTLTRAAGIRSYERAVDLGGDEGQFFPSAAEGLRLVVEASDRPLRPGVQRLASLEDLAEVEDRPDLVLMSHVLEHLADPLSTVRAVRAVIAKGGIFYVEVPLDRFSTTRFHATASYANYLARLSRVRPGFIAADLVTGIFRQRRSAVPSFGVVKASEHLTYFSPRSLEALLVATGFEPLGSGSEPGAKVGGLRLGRHALVARAC